MTVISIVATVSKSVHGRNAAVKTCQKLVWHPCKGQMDFGEADFYEKSKICRGKYFIVYCSYISREFCQVLGGETEEYFCQEIKDIFAYIGKVTRVPVFDNATGVATGSAQRSGKRNYSSDAGALQISGTFL